MNRLLILFTSLLILTALGCTTKVVKKEVAEQPATDKTTRTIADDSIPEQPTSGFLPQPEAKPRTAIYSVSSLRILYQRGYFK